MVDGDAGLTRGHADCVAEPGVGRSLRVHHVARRVRDEDGCALVCARTDKELKQEGNGPVAPASRHLCFEQFQC